MPRRRALLLPIRGRGVREPAEDKPRGRARPCVGGWTVVCLLGFGLAVVGVNAWSRSELSHVRLRRREEADTVKAWLPKTDE